MVIALAGSMDLPVLAEGVETAELHRALARVGCQQFQGFYFGRPMPVEEFEAMVREHARANTGALNHPLT